MSQVMPVPGESAEIQTLLTPPSLIKFDWKIEVVQWKIVSHTVAAANQMLSPFVVYLQLLV